MIFAFIIVNCKQYIYSTEAVKKINIYVELEKFVFLLSQFFIAL
jgi:hypothetical protein